VHLLVSEQYIDSNNARHNNKSCATIKFVALLFTASGYCAVLRVTAPCSNYKPLLMKPVVSLRPHSVKRWNVGGLKVFSIVSTGVQKI